MFFVMKKLFVISELENSTANCYIANIKLIGFKINGE